MSDDQIGSMAQVGASCADPVRGLSRIPRAYIVGAMDHLPPCGPEATVQYLQIEVPLRGRFRVTFKPFRQTLRGWRSRWFWIAGGAESESVGLVALRPQTLT